jgi:predicted methyltransferase
MDERPSRPNRSRPQAGPPWTARLENVLVLLALTYMTATLVMVQTGPTLAALSCCVIASSLLIAAVTAAARGGARRSHWWRLLTIMGASSALLAISVAGISASWLPIDLPGWLLLHAFAQSALLLALWPKPRLHHLLLAALVTPVLFLFLMASVAPTQSPALPLPSWSAATHIGFGLLATIPLVFALRFRANPLLLLPAAIFLTTSTIAMQNASYAAHPSAFGDLATHPSRDIIAHPEQVLALMDLQEGDDVADIGAGTGYYTFRMAREVGPTGSVVATDTDYAWTLGQLMAKKMADPELNPYDNVRMWTHKRRDTQLEAESADLVLLSQVTAMLVDPDELPWVSTQRLFPWPESLGAWYPGEERLVRSCWEALRPGGRLVVIHMLDDPADPFPPSKLFHYFASDVETVVRNYEATGFRLLSQHDLYLNDAHKEAMERFRQEPNYDVMAEFFMGRSKFFLIFEKVEG